MRSSPIANDVHQGPTRSTAARAAPTPSGGMGFLNERAFESSVTRQRQIVSLRRVAFGKDDVATAFVYWPEHRAFANKSRD